MNLEQLKYPIGKFEMPERFDDILANQWISEIEVLPKQVSVVTVPLKEEQLNLNYRPGGWTVRQVIHHLPDSHLNAYTRFKLAFTEHIPVVRPYEEDLWAETYDSKNGPVDMSINLLASLHERWVYFLRSLKIEDYQRCYIHPAQEKQLTLAHMLGMYAWHGKHHLAHLTNAINNL